MSQKTDSLLPNAILFGEIDEDLLWLESLACKCVTPVAEPLLSLVDAARIAGFTLKIASSFRSFDRQLVIWNAKAQGLRAVLDDSGQPIAMESLSDAEKMWAILRWSALPGASRHHWGTDFDVYDSSRMPADYQVQLTQAETEQGGYFADFHRWLNAELEKKSCGFFRPYREGVGRIAPEPWHLSYAPIANQYAAQLTEEKLREKISHTEIALKDTILHALPSIYAHYVEPYSTSFF